MAGIIEINSIGWWLKQHFGEKVVKLSLDGGFTCPNRDGTCGVGGCIFCSPEGSGELSSSFGDKANPDVIADALKEQIRLRAEKWPKVKSFIAYYQNYTNTYGPIHELRAKYEGALAALDDDPDRNIAGLAIATRPDCLSGEVLDLLSELKEKTFLWVELGLQTIHGDYINRGYDLEVYDEAVRNLSQRGIRFVTHLILGLPGKDGCPETRDMMFESVRYVTKPLPFGEDGHLFGLKLHLMNVVKGSALESMYPGYDPFTGPEEYMDLVCDLLEIIPKDVTIHRLTGDVPRKILVAPEWSYKKRTILNGIARNLRMRGSTQGCKL